MPVCLLFSIKYLTWGWNSYLFNKLKDKYLFYIQPQKVDEAIMNAARMLQCDSQIFESTKISQNRPVEQHRKPSKTLHDLTKMADSLLKQVPRKNSMQNLGQLSGLRLLPPMKPSRFSDKKYINQNPDEPSHTNNIMGHVSAFSRNSQHSLNQMAKFPSKLDLPGNLKTPKEMPGLEKIGNNIDEQSSPISTEVSPRSSEV